MIVNRSLYSSLPFDLEKDFVPVSTFVNVSYVLVTNPSVAISVQDLIAKAKARPGRISYASSGPGTPLHLIGEAFKKQAGVDIVHTPYKGAPLALADLMGGHVQMMFPGLPVVQPLLKSGHLRALAVASKHRLALLPDVPTLEQAGVPGIEETDWYGLVAPRGTPANVVARLNDEVVKLMKSPGVRESLTRRGFEPTGSTPQEFAALIETEQRRWPAVVRQAGLKPE
jgi:tripartite-type tricarboxylate transporter receptor subunit TctC